MAVGEFEKALEGAREIEITVTGRRSGRQITVPIWFVQDDGTLYLLPVRGADADWYKNLVKSPTISLAVDEAEGQDHRRTTSPCDRPTRGSVGHRDRSRGRSTGSDRSGQII